MTLHYSLEAVTLRYSNYIYIVTSFKHFNGYGVAKVQFLVEACELGQVSLGSHSSLLEVSHQGCRSILLLCLLETELNGIVTILLYTLDLSNHTRTQFDNSAWYILTLGTEYGSHSDFLS